MIMFSWLYNSFPRQLGFPNRITVTSRNEFLEYVNRFNGKLRIYASVYNYVPGEEHLITLDKVFFDFDGEEAFNDMAKLVTHLNDHDYCFTFFFSGGGYHVYLFLDTSERIINRKDCLANIQRYFQKECDITIDPAVIGDIARIATVPNTYNLKRKKFCIPLLMDDVEESHEMICKYADRQMMNGKVYGTKRFDPKIFDYPSSNIVLSGNDKYAFEADELSVGDDIYQYEFHPCIFNMLAVGHSTHIGFLGRYRLLVYLRDVGISAVDAQSIIKRHLTSLHEGNPEWKNCFKKRQIERVYSDETYPFVKCEKMMNEGFCPGKCDRVRNYGRYTRADIYM